MLCAELRETRLWERVSQSVVCDCHALQLPSGLLGQSLLVVELHCVVQHPFVFLDGYHIHDWFAMPAIVEFVYPLLILV